MDIIKTLFKYGINGLTLSLVNLSKIIAITASLGVDISYGLRTAIWSGWFSIFLNTPFLVPSGSLVTIILLENINVENFPIYTFMSSIILTIILLLFNGYKYIGLCPNTIWDAFLIALVVTTFFSQFDHIFGINCEARKFKNGLEKIINKSQCLMNNINSINYFSAIFYFVSYILLYTLSKKFSKIPWFLIFLFLGIILSLLEKAFNFNIGFKRIFENNKTIEFSLFKIMELSIFDLIQLLKSIEFYTTSFSISILVLWDVFVTFRTLEKLENKKIVKKSKDFISVIICSLASIITGILPVTLISSITTLNQLTGVKNNINAFLNGVFCLIISYTCTQYINLIPMNFLDIMLITIFSIISDFGSIIYNFKYNKNDFFLMMMTVVLSILFSGAFPILLGTLIYLMINARDLMKLKYETKKFWNLKSNKIIYDKFLKFYNNENKIDDINNKIGNINKKVKSKEILKEDKVFTKLLASNENIILYDSIVLKKIKDKIKIKNNILVYRFLGNISYLNIERHLDIIKKLISNNDYEIILISFRFMITIDQQSLNFLVKFKKFIKSKNNELFFISLIDYNKIKKFMSVDLIDKNFLNFENL